MNIEYTYRITNVDKQAKSMEIMYESSKYGVLHVGARMPWEDETLEDVVRMYNPVNYWLEKEKEVLDVEVGAYGVQSISLEPSVQPDNSEDRPDNSEDQFYDLFPTQPSGSIEVTTLGE